MTGDPTGEGWPREGAEPDDITAGDIHSGDTDTDLDGRQLRKALGTVNDLEPPTDELFVQRAILRGRARTSRRRSTVLGAAAAIVVVGAVGGTWIVNNGNGFATSSGSAAGGAIPAAASAESDAGVDNGLKSAEGGAPGTPVPDSSNPSAPPVLGARDSTVWIGGAVTAQRTAFESVEPTLVASFPDVFSGAYAADATNTRIVVAVTRADAALESMVRSAMPAPSDVEFVTAGNSYSAKQKVAAQVAADFAYWRSQGIDVLSVRQDGRTDRVVVVADEGSRPGAIAQRYGSGIVTVVPGTATAPGKLPDGSTLPTLQR